MTASCDYCAALPALELELRKAWEAAEEASEDGTRGSFRRSLGSSLSELRAQVEHCREESIGHERTCPDHPDYEQEHTCVVPPGGFVTGVDERRSNGVRI